MSYYNLDFFKYHITSFGSRLHRPGAETIGGGGSGFDYVILLSQEWVLITVDYGGGGGKNAKK